MYMYVQVNFMDIFLWGMRDRSTGMRSGMEFEREICCLTAFLDLSSFNLSNKLGSIFVSHSDSSLPEKNLNCLPFFKMSIQFFACALHENWSNQSSGVQILCDIRSCFGHYLYSMKCSWIVKKHTTVAPRYNEPRYNKDSVITNNIWKPSRIKVKDGETNPAIMNPLITKSPL